MKEKPIIGLVMKSLEAEFFQEMKQGAIEYAISTLISSYNCWNLYSN